MTIQSTFISNPVKTIIVNQTASTSVSGVGDNNVAGGACYLISATIANTNFGGVTYTKLSNLASYTAGTNTADYVLRTPANGTRTYVFHPPVYFSNGLSFATTTTAGQAGTTAPGTPPAVTLILSTSAT
jgi:hypothetical protein